MKDAITKVVLHLIFGKYAGDGFYHKNLNSKNTATYIFGSVFPDKETMNTVFTSK